MEMVLLKFKKQEEKGAIEEKEVEDEKSHQIVTAIVTICNNRPCLGLRQVAQRPMRKNMRRKK